MSKEILFHVLSLTHLLQVTSYTDAKIPNFKVYISRSRTYQPESLKTE